MNYPTIEAVNAADRNQICAWYRFLPSPGISALNRVGEGRPYDEFEAALAAEKIIMDRICERFAELGGMTPAISKAVGWDR